MGVTGPSRPNSPFLLLLFTFKIFESFENMHELSKTRLSLNRFSKVNRTFCGLAEFASCKKITQKKLPKKTVSVIPFSQKIFGLLKHPIFQNLLPQPKYTEAFGLFLQKAVHFPKNVPKFKTLTGTHGLSGD